MAAIFRRRSSRGDPRFEARWREEASLRLRTLFTPIAALATAFYLLSVPVDYYYLSGTPERLGDLALRLSVIPIAVALILFVRRRPRPAWLMELLLTAGFVYALIILARIAAHSGIHWYHLDLGFNNILVFVAIIMPWETWKTVLFILGTWALYAALTLQWMAPGDWLGFTARHLAMFVFAMTAAGASWLRNTLLRRELAERMQLEDLTADLSCLAERDELTGLYNYRSFWGVLREQVAQAERHGRCLALILLDLDGFKAYNDTYGHLQGDALLRRLGALLAETVRGGDLAFRQGGDEFAVILPDTDPEAAGAVAARLDERIAAGLADPGGVRVTASFGVACCHRSDYDPEALVERADTDLYRNKRRCSGEADDPSSASTPGGAA